MKIECYNVASKSRRAASLPVCDLGNGNERDSGGAARCRVHEVVLDNLAILAKSERSRFVDYPTRCGNANALETPCVLWPQVAPNPEPSTGEVSRLFFVFASNHGQLLRRIIPFQNYLLMAFDSAGLTILATSPSASTGRVALLPEKRPPYPTSVGSTAL
jgi:hypothetical protein